MTRLVGVRAVCDGCLSAPATIFCVDHRLVLCPKCNLELHQPPTNHQRVDLDSSVTALPFCEHCDDAPATVYCQSEGITLCDKCDRAVHAPGQNHTRTPIESTLRNRAVEFRGRTRRRPSTKLLKSTRHDSNQTQSPTTQIPTPESTTDASQRNHPTKTSTSPKSTLRKTASPKRRASKVIQKRKARTNIVPSTNPPPQISHPQSLSPDTPMPNAPRPQPELLEQDHYSNLFHPGPSSNYPLSNMPDMPPGSLTDPLLGDAITAFRDSPTYADTSATPPLAFDSILTYGTLDLNSNNRFDGVSAPNGNATPAPLRGGQGLHGYHLSQHGHGGELSAGRVPPNTPQPNVMAAAAVAAGEQFLLNSGSSGSSSSRERLTPPLNHVPDPAGVAVAATAAAASAAVDLGHVARTEGFAVSVAEALESVSGGHRQNENTIGHHGTVGSTGTIEQATIGDGSSGQGISEDDKTTARIARGAGQGAHGLQGVHLDCRQDQMGQSGAGQREMFDEVMSGLEPDHERGLAESGMGRAMRYEIKQENSIGRSGGLFGQLGDEDMLRRSTDPMGDLEMGNDFGFDTVDLGQFEHNGPPSMPFGLPEERGKDAGWEEG